QCGRPRPPAARQVRLPAGRAALDRADHTAPYDEDPHVAAVMVDGALNIIYPPDRLQRPEHAERHLLGRHAYHTEPHRTEQRLHDHVPERLARRYGAVQAPAHPGSGRPDPPPRADRGCPQVVHRAVATT